VQALIAAAADDTHAPHPIPLRKHAIGQGVHEADVDARIGDFARMEAEHNALRPTAPQEDDESSGADRRIDGSAALEQVSRNPFPLVEPSSERDERLRKSMRDVLEAVLALTAREQTFAIYCQPHDGHYFLITARYFSVNVEHLKWTVCGKLSRSPVSNLDALGGRYIRAGDNHRPLTVQIEGTQKLYLPSDMRQTDHGIVQGARDSRYGSQTHDVAVKLRCYPLLPTGAEFYCWLHEYGTGDLARWHHVTDGTRDLSDAAVRSEPRESDGEYSAIFPPLRLQYQ